MPNLLVRGIDPLIEALEVRGIPVEQRQDWNHPETVRFACVHDADGNLIDLWEPPGG